MARTEEENAAMSKMRYKAELALLTNIADDELNSSIIRDYAEAYALLTGKLTSQAVTVKNG
jgi:hypothetical protein